MRWIATVSGAAVLLLTACQSAAPPPTPAPPTAAAPAAPAAAPTTAPTPIAKPTAAVPAAPTAVPTAVPAAAPTTAPTAAPQARLVVDVEADLESLDPYLAYSPTGLSIHHNLFDYLLERDVRGELAPGLAESWKATGPTTLEFKLRRGVKFHNGQDVTASAVKFSAERMLDEKLNSGVRSRFTSIKSVNVVDPYTVQFELAKPDPSLLDSLTNQMAILPESFDAAKPIGSGPYRFAEWVRGDHITLDANTGYWTGSAKGRPVVASVVFRPVTSAGTRLADLQSGQAHIVAGLSPTQAKALEKAGAGPTVQVADLPGYQYVFFNTKVDDASPLKDARVRQALNLAIDRRAIVESLLGNYVKPLKEPVGPLTAGYDPALPDLAYDPARARQLLTEAGVGSGFALTLDVSQADRDDVVDAVAAQLGQVGVNVTVQTLDLSAFNDRWIAHKMDGLFFVRWNNFSDPGTLNLLASCNGFLSFFCSPAADEFFTQGEATLDDAVRVKAYQQAMGALADDPFAIYLTTRSALYGVSDRVSGWTPSASGYLYATDARLR
jgi:peptide/nickel transport system substrate-binding protein